jgi:hypothetical protein
VSLPVVHHDCTARGGVDAAGVARLGDEPDPRRGRGGYRQSFATAITAPTIAVMVAP